MRLLITNIFLLSFVSTIVLGQGWQQTASTPEGAGVTDLVVRESNQHIFVTTASFNFPNGDYGGVRRSTDEGATWENLIDVYVARTMIDGIDGNLYASIWPYPSDEGLYRSTDNGDSWGSPLVTVPSGNNIFSIALNPTTPTQTIFAGTRNGPLRSTDNGTSWSPANNGIPANSWVRDIEVDSNGIVAAATTNGLFISTDNGNTWQETSGITDTIVTLVFDYPLTTDNYGGDTRLLAGSVSGQVLEAVGSDNYLIATLGAILSPDEEIADFFVMYLKGQNKERHGIATFPRNNQDGGYYESTDNGQTWVKKNTGLPNNPKTSALSGVVVETRKAVEIKEYLGFFDNSNGGARIFKRETVVSVEKVNNLTLSTFSLSQNYPNPFNPSTTINFSIPEESFVSLKVFNSLGQEIETLVSKDLGAGNYKYDWNAKNFTSGIYFYTIQTDDFIETKKMILLK